MEPDRKKRVVIVKRPKGDSTVQGNAESQYRQSQPSVTDKTRGNLFAAFTGNIEFKHESPGKTPKHYSPDMRATVQQQKSEINTPVPFYGRGGKSVEQKFGRNDVTFATMSLGANKPIPRNRSSMRVPTF